MIPKMLKRAYELRQSYKAVFGTPDGKMVLQDLMKRYMLTSPAAINSDATLINVGMQKVVQNICAKVYGSDEQFREAIRDAYETTNQEQE